MCQGTVFNIQKFSIHDGPGIRTTVFLKGCPLRCKWCANPESQSFKTQILYDHDKCIGCGRCTAACQTKAVSADSRGWIQIDEQKCIGCKSCTAACSSHALTFEGEKKTVPEVMDVCLQDLDFYEESGGGVTISGGEGMAQPAFAAALLDALHQQQIHTAIETTGYTPEESFRHLAGKLDLLLFDMKHWDSEKHRQGTGVDTGLILRNLKWALDTGQNVLVRIPVIPGFNDSLKDAKEFGRLLKSLHAKKVQLLPFHQMGENKYRWLNKTYAYENVRPLHPEDLQAYRQIICEQGVNCFV